MGDPGRRAAPSPDWRALYESALVEADHRKILLRIDEAEQAVRERLQILKRSGDSWEGAALVNALNVLRDLRRMGG